jgi:poly(3-hydroxybutyrate) depolymerase
MTSNRLFGAAVLVSCCVAPSRAGAEWRTETVAEMTVELFVPASPRALLVALHGCTQSPEALRDRGNFEAAAEQHGAVVALPAVPNGGVVAGCWDYYGADHSLDGRHDRYLIALVDALLAGHPIDPRRVYLIGLSSGAGEAFVMGCLAPDRFAGIGINAGPAVGTDISEFGTVSTDRDSAAAVCRALAGARADGFETQLTSTIQGDGDFVVARGYNRLNAEIMASIYGAETESSLDVTSLPGQMPRGEGAIWSDALGPRVSMILVEGMGHAFPAGEGDGLETSFVSQRGVAWPSYVLSFFEENNRRLDRPVPPDGGVVLPGGDASTGTDASRQDAEDPQIPTDPQAGCACTGTRDPSSLWMLLLFIKRRR